MKPDFLCIGSPKCGTTWLHDLLQSHPQVFLPKEIKEVHYFDRYYSRGEPWYLKLFEPTLEHQIAGEVTPHYLYISSIDRLKNANPNFKLLLFVRDPADRCLSHYKYRKRLDNYQGTLEEFLVDYPSSIEWGYYGKYLNEFLKYFSPSQFLIVNFDTAIKEPENLKAGIASFLSIDSHMYPVGAGTKKVNQDMTPAHPRLYSFSVHLSKILVDLKLYRLRNFIKSKTIQIIKKKSNVKPDNNYSEEQHLMLQNLYKEDQQLMIETASKLNIRVI